MIILELLFSLQVAFSQLPFKFKYPILILLISYLIFFSPFRIMPSKYRCPRCKSTRIREYDDFIECSNCLLDFDKELIGKVPDEELMARKEMDGLLNGFEELKDPKIAKELFDSIMDDLEDLDGSA
ncbi:MAG: hypothetical protein ACXAAI_10410 [Promethearchaeota archaeon]|jgi:hypothetical protein